jgi:cysteine desulfurase
MAALAPLEPTMHSDEAFTMPHVANLSIGDIDSEALMLALKDVVAISNGSACTSASYSPSHVLKAMQLTDETAETATRWSWCHLTEEPDWEAVRQRIKMLL